MNQKRTQLSKSKLLNFTFHLKISALTKSRDINVKRKRLSRIPISWISISMFGHVGKWDRSIIDICVKCRHTRYEEHTCSTLKCANCKEVHMT